MESLELLAREDEFKKLNRQLERKTESLMKEIEYVMKKQDIFSEFSHNLTLTPTRTPKKHTCTSPIQENLTPTKPIEKVRKTVKPPKIEANCQKPNNYSLSSDEEVCTKKVVCDCCINSKNSRPSEDLEFLQAFVSVNVQEKVLPNSFLKDTITTESVCKFLSSKAKLLQDQIDVMQATLDKKAAQCKVHLTHQAELEGERMSLLTKNNHLKAAAADAKARSAGLEAKIAEKDRLYKEQRSECDRLSVELKRARGDYAAVCSRNAAQSEAIATLTQQLKAAKAEHLEFRDSTRQLSASNQAAILGSEARNKNLAATIDKQMALIDNLRKQNAILRTEGALRVLEKGYSEFLSRDL